MPVAGPARADHVILVHGLARSPQSMQPMEKALQGAGYQTVNLRHPSRKKTVRALAGDRSINSINSRMIPGPDDGKVSVENPKAEGMSDHVVVHRTHPMIMKRREVIDLTLRFLAKGSFAP